MAKKQQKELEAIQKEREDLEQLKKQKAQEQAKLNAERITATEQKEVLKQQQKNDLLAVKEAVRFREIRLRKEANTRKAEDRRKRVATNEKVRWLKQTAAKEARI